ncbi:Uncharacterised protein [Vibrio cholerae]|uniref:Uncharacterized protein n=1 Tax=Vibrio cholerae TaxID=666 RepID=A0A655NSX9_VIBCL|nr:Uncharacterised protein [Vibrio cholerae]CSB97162.1 Uncharacterised protein [Vibrio cholerae]
MNRNQRDDRRVFDEGYCLPSQRWGNGGQHLWGNHIAVFAPRWQAKRIRGLPLSLWDVGEPRSYDFSNISRREQPDTQHAGQQVFPQAGRAKQPSDQRVNFRCVVAQ